MANNRSATTTRGRPLHSFQKRVEGKERVLQLSKSHNCSVQLSVSENSPQNCRD